MPLDLLSPRRLDYANPVNGDAPLNRGLLGWWQVLPRRLGGSRLLDLTGRAPMVLTGFGASSATQGWGPTQRPGGWGELRWPAAASAQGSVPAIPLLASAPAVTLAGWVWQQTLDVIGYLWNQFTNSLDQWAIETWSDGFLYIELNVGSGTLGQIDYSTVMAAQTWTHLTVVFQGSGATNADRLKFYVNGLPRTLTYSGTLPSLWPDVQPQPLIFGRSGSASSAWNGKLDDWRLWLRALAPPEVQALYLRSRLRYPQELRWRSPLHVVPILGYEPPVAEPSQAIAIQTTRTLDYGYPANRDAPLNRGLIAWWQVLPRRRGGARWFDLTGRLAAALSTLSPSSATRGWGATARLGGRGELRLDGTGSLTVPSASALNFGTGDFTVLVWVRFRTVAGASREIAILSKAVTYNLDPGWVLEGHTYAPGSATQVAFTLWNTGGFPYTDTVVNSLSTVPVGTWAQVGLRRQGTTFSLLLNGRVDGVTTHAKVAVDVSNAAALLMGGTVFGQDLLNGALDDVRLWSRALSDQELLACYSASRLGSLRELNWLAWPPGWAGAAAGVAPGAGIVRQMMQHAA
jgi:Concanavalin A-like lectin/glucanases superfamily